jgi:uncharacterized membrane protein YqaE (UPF0057 family)
MKGYFRTKIIQGLLCAFMWVCGFLLFFWIVNKKM